MPLKVSFLILVLFAVAFPAAAQNAAGQAKLCARLQSGATCKSNNSLLLQSRISSLQLQCKAELNADPQCSQLIKSMSANERKDKFNDCSLRDVCDANTAFDNMADGCGEAVYEFGKEKWDELKLTWQRMQDSEACNSDLQRKLGMFDDYNQSMPPILQRPVLPLQSLEAMNCSEIARVLNGFALITASMLEQKLRSFETQNPKLKGKYASYPRDLAEFKEWQLATAASEAAKYRQTVKSVRDLPRKVQMLFQNFGINLRCYNAKQRTKIACFGTLLVGSMAFNPVGSVTRGSLRTVSLLMKAAGKAEAVKEAQSVTTLTERFRKLYEQAEINEQKRLVLAETARRETFPVPVVTEPHFQNIQDLYRAGDFAAAAAYERKIANTLSNAAMEFVGDVGEGVAGAKYVKFADGTHGIWKPDRIIAENINASGAAGEIAAFKVDQYLDLHKVPVTVSRRLNGERGTVQLLVGDLRAQGITRDPNELKLFDYLIDNRDRHSANYLRTTDGRIVAIDHGLASQIPTRGHDLPAELDFIVSQAQALAKNAPASAQATFKSDALNQLASIVGERDAYLKLKNTSEQAWRSLLRNEMNERQMSEFIARRSRIVDAVERARAKFGDEIFRVGPSSPLLQ
jgi:hypothetical protein